MRDKKLLLQHLNALERLARLGIIARDLRDITLEEVEAWTAELREALKTL